MKDRLVSGLATVFLLAGCTGPTIAPGWTVTERTRVIPAGKPEAVGIQAMEDRPLTPGYRTAVGSRCHSSLADVGPAPLTTAREAELPRAVFRPGVGSHLRLGFWSTSTSAGGGAVFVPLNLQMDVVLRRIGRGGQLTSSERVVLDTLLATSRLRRSDGSQPEAWAKDGANTVANNEATLWNALVETLCISIVTERDSTPSRPLLRAEADLSHLCEAVQDENQRLAFARLFVRPRAEGYAHQYRCHLEGAAEDSQTRLQTAEPHRGHRIQKLIGGVGQDESAEPLGSTSAVAAGAGYRMPGDFYAPQPMVKVGATGEIRMQSPRFGDLGTEQWTLRDWEQSAICRDPRPGAGEPFLSSVNVDGATFTILRQGEVPTHQVRRILGPEGYRFEIERIPGVQGPASLAEADLALLHPGDVSFTNWRVERGGRRLWSRPSCARR